MISLDRSLENDNVSKIMETNTGGLVRGEERRGLWGLINSTGAQYPLAERERRECPAKCRD